MFVSLCQDCSRSLVINCTFHLELRHTLNSDLSIDAGIIVVAFECFNRALATKSTC
jgi:hypothetical protein